MGRRDPHSFDSYDMPRLGGEFAIVGYNFHGQAWRDVENGAWPLERHEGSPPDMDRVERMTILYTNPETGQEIYKTIREPFPDDWDDVVDYVEYIMDPYAEV